MTEADTVSFAACTYVGVALRISTMAEFTVSCADIMSEVFDFLFLITDEMSLAEIIQSQNFRTADLFTGTLLQAIAGYFMELVYEHPVA